MSRKAIGGEIPCPPGPDRVEPRRVGPCEQAQVGAWEASARSRPRPRAGPREAQPRLALRRRRGVVCRGGLVLQGCATAQRPDGGELLLVVAKLQLRKLALENIPQLAGTLPSNGSTMSPPLASVAVLIGPILPCSSCCSS